MESSVIWPSFGLNVAFVAACVFFIMMQFVRKKVSEEKDFSFENTGEFFLDVVTNRYLLMVACVLCVATGFIVTLCLLHRVETEGFIFFAYILLVILLPLIPVACVADCPYEDFSATFGGFLYGAGQSLVGLVFLVSNHFPYMWYALAFLFLNLIGLALEFFRLKKRR